MVAVVDLMAVVEVDVVVVAQEEVATKDQVDLLQEVATQVMNLEDHQDIHQDQKDQVLLAKLDQKDQKDQRSMNITVGQEEKTVIFQIVTEIGKEILGSQVKERKKEKNIVKENWSKIKID